MIDNPKDSANSVETALASLQPIRDLAKNWDIDIAAWYDLVFISVWRVWIGNVWWRNSFHYSMERFIVLTILCHFSAWKNTFRTWLEISPKRKGEISPNMPSRWTFLRQRLCCKALPMSTVERLSTYTTSSFRFTMSSSRALVVGMSVQWMVPREKHLWMPK